MRTGRLNVIGADPADVFEALERTDFHNDFRVITFGADFIVCESARFPRDRDVYELHLSGHPSGMRIVFIIDPNVPDSNVRGFLMRYNVPAKRKPEPAIGKGTIWMQTERLVRVLQRLGRDSNLMAQVLDDFTIDWANIVTLENRGVGFRVTSRLFEPDTDRNYRLLLGINPDDFTTYAEVIRDDDWPKASVRRYGLNGAG